jgi:hypothetical protein
MRPFPDMLPYFEEKDLPALQVLSLHTDDHTPLFTAAELLEWGAQGGWDKLKTLSFQNMDYLPAFLGHTPILANLGVLLRRKRDADTLQRYIEAAGLSSPLGCQLGHLQFSGPRSKTYTRPQDRCLIPWYLLNVAPNLTTLHLHTYIRVPFLPELCMDTPTAQEVHDISKLCPDLAEIRLDMELIFSRSHKPLWPSEVLTALAQFKRPIKLMIYLHAKNPGTANSLLNQAVYKKVFNRIVDERERLGLPCYPPFEVSFKIVRRWTQMQKHIDFPDVRLTWQNGRNRLTFERVVGARSMTLQEGKDVLTRKWSKLRCAIWRTLHGDKNSCVRLNGGGSD